MASAPTAPAVGAAATPPGEWRPPGRSRADSTVTLEDFLAAVARVPGSCVEYADGSVKVSFSDRRDRTVQKTRQKPASGPPAAVQPHKSRAMLRREQRQRQAQRQQQQQQPPEPQPVQDQHATEQQLNEQLAGVEPAAADEAALDAWLDSVAMGADQQREQNAAARASGFAAAAASSLRAALDDVAIANVASDRRAAATDSGKRQAAARMQ